MITAIVLYKLPASIGRYGMYPEITYFTTTAITDNPGGKVTILDEGG